MPTYKEHHVRYSHCWASKKGTPVEVANQLIDQWNGGLSSDEIPYKKTSALIRAIGILIFLRRKGSDINQILDIDPNGYDVDPLCVSCKICKK